MNPSTVLNPAHVLAVPSDTISGSQSMSSIGIVLGEWLGNDHTCLWMQHSF